MVLLQTVTFGVTLVLALWTPIFGCHPLDTRQVVTVDSASTSSCRKPLVRKEWRKLPKESQLDYINAVRCLQTKSTITSAYFPGTRTRFDDFLACHIDQANYIHFVGQFQAWHRGFMAFYERALREECGYAGAQPYWDWSLDSSSGDAWVNSPVFDPVYGFGGNGPYINSTDIPLPLHVPGKTGGGCVLDGPFKDYQISVGPGANLSYNPHCLTRDIAPEFGASTSKPAAINLALSKQTFWDFDREVQGYSLTPGGFRYHASAHGGVGGDLGLMNDYWASPGDPIFYLHHTNIDRLWWKWQKKDLKKRLLDISGPTIAFTYPYEFQGPGGTSPNVTLDYEMYYGEFFPKSSLKVRDVMNVQGDLLCYDYQ